MVGDGTLALAGVVGTIGDGTLALAGVVIGVGTSDGAGMLDGDIMADGAHHTMGIMVIHMGMAQAMLTIAVEEDLT